MDVVSCTLILCLLALLWQCISIVGPRAVVTPVQSSVHDWCGRASGLLQWYSVLLLGLGFLLLWTFWDIVKFEYTRYDLLQNDDLHLLPNLTESEKHELEITPTLGMLALTSPCAGTFAGGVVLYHVANLAVNSARESQTQHGGNTHRMWFLSRKLNAVLLVIVMPMVFIVMALRAQIRVLSVMTGSAWLPFHRESPPALAWDDVKGMEMGNYEVAIEVAQFFQYFTVLGFAILCMHFLRGTTPRLVLIASFQGVWLYVGCGLMRSICMAIFEVARLFYPAAFVVVADTIEEKVLGYIAPVFFTATIMCVANMMIVCGMTEVKRKIDHAAKKFMASRWLVMAGQLQLGVLSQLEVGSSLYSHLQKVWPAGAVDAWFMSDMQVKLLHTSLLIFECLVVVLFNFHYWDFREFREVGNEESNEISSSFNADSHSNDVGA